jgi:uncharacterized protein (TIGR02246 family)
LDDVIAADNARDLSSVLQCYARDVVWLPPHGDPVEGLEAVRARYEKMYAEFRPALTVHVTGVQSGDGFAAVWGLTGGALKPVDGGATRAVDDRFLALVESEQGRWRIRTMMWRPDGS